MPTRPGRSVPRWFRSWPARLLLFVETASGSSGRAEISVGATIRLLRRKLFRFQAALDKAPEVAVIAIPAIPPVPPTAPVS